MLAHRVLAKGKGHATRIALDLDKDDAKLAKVLRNLFLQSSVTELLRKTRRRELDSTVGGERVTHLATNMQDEPAYMVCGSTLSRKSW